MEAHASLSEGFISNTMDNPKNKNHSSIKLRSEVLSSTQKISGERKEETCTPLDEMTESGI